MGVRPIPEPSELRAEGPPDARPVAGRVALGQRVASALIRGYVKHFPVERGKYRLLRGAASFLVVELEPGTFVRITDVCNPIEARIVRHGMLEPDDVRFFLALLGPGMTVLDVGANIGQYTLLAARRVGAAGRIHAFEPTPAVAASLRRNVAFNGLSNVVLNEVAVSATPGSATFHMHPEDSDTNTIVAAYEGGTSIVVPAVTLDGYLFDHDLTAADVMKIDIEGAEMLALQGAKALLSGAGAPVILIEFNEEALTRNGASTRALREQLEGYGYTCYALSSYSGGSYSNVLAAKPRHFDRFAALHGRRLVPVVT